VFRTAASARKAKGRKGSMISLREAIAPAGHRWERALFLCYQADLPYLERTLLLDLQHSGTSTISILVDPADVEQSYSEANAINHVGVNYSYDRLTLPAPSAAFHAKVYLLFGRDQIRLVVTSGNLTAGGITRNLEIIDVLTLDATGNGDRTAFMGCAAFLRAIPGLCPGLGIRASEAVRSADARISERLARTGTETASVSVFLHNATAPLLGQLVANVPANEVSELIVVSPFYDRQSRAVIELAKAYPKADIRVVKRGKAKNDMNGEALAPFEDRLRVEGFRAVDEHDRTLHAKAMLLAGVRQQWLAVGSANMTAPAWLVSAKSGGNLETMVLRTIVPGRNRAVRQPWDDLFGKLRTTKVKLSDLSFTLPEAPAQAASTVRIVRAHVASGGIEVECRFSQPNADLGELLLRLADRERSVELHPEVRSRSGADLVIWAPINGGIEEDLTLGNYAVLITLSPANPSDSHWSARAWLEKPQYLSLSAAERERRHALALLTRQMFVQDVHLFRVAELIMQTALAMSTELRRLVTANVPPVAPARVAGGTRSAESAPGTPEDIEVADVDWDALLGSDTWDEPDLDQDFMDVEDEVAETGSTRGGAGRPSVLGQLDNYLHDSLRSLDPLFSGKNAIEPRSGKRRPVDPDEMSGSRVADELELPDPDGDEMLRSAAESIRRGASQVRRTQLAPENVGRVADTFLVIVAHLYRLELHARLWKSPAAEDIRHVREVVWFWTWGLDGWECGRCAAWMPRAWAKRSLRQQVRALVSEPAYMSRLLTLAAASWRLSSDRAAVPDGILAGIGLVSGVNTSADGPLAQQLRRTATELSHLPLTQEESRMALQGLRAVSPLESPGARAALHWRPLQLLLSGTPSTPDVQAVLASLGEALGNRSSHVVREVARRIPRKLFGTVHDLANVPSCSRCNQRLSTTLTQQLGQGTGTGIVCEGCGAWLIPFAWDDVLCSSIMDQASSSAAPE
jgi:hypothetical protein